jgi:hypothetical protein
MTGAIGFPGATGLAFPPRPSQAPAAPAAGGSSLRPAHGHDALGSRPHPSAGALAGQPLRVDASALPQIRPSHGRLTTHAAKSGEPAPADEGPRPFDFSGLDFPMVFPMQPIDPVNPARVPHTPAPEGAKYPNTVPMLSAYANEQHGMVFGQKVPYLSETERASFKISVKDGLLMGADGAPVDTRQATASGETTGRAIYVMDHAGEMYLANESGLAEFQHTSFLAGQPVAAAGTIRVEDGQVKEITRSSGHYRPAPEFLDQAVAELHAKGVPPGFTVINDIGR